MITNQFIFVAPMFNAAETLPRMLHSLFGQSYDNWRLILIDDMSSDDQKKACKKIITAFDRLQSVTYSSNDPQNLQKNESSRNFKHSLVIWNDEKKWEVANVLHGISLCNDDDIICRIDADDWLTDLDALAYLNALYNHSGADALWTAHRWAHTDKNISGPMPGDADPYQHPWVSSHLKTFRKRLLNGVPYENFTNMNGELVRRAGDQALYLPCLYRAARRGYVPRVFYHYTIKDEPATYQTDDAHFQRDEAIHLRSRGYISTGVSWEDKLNGPTAKSQ